MTVAELGEAILAARGSVLEEPRGRVSPGRRPGGASRSSGRWASRGTWSAATATGCWSP